MTDTPNQENESLLKFPCDFTIKVFGLANDEFETTVLSIINKHVSNMSDRTFQTRPSDKGKYVAMTITVHIDSKEQLDQIYRELSSSPHVIMAL